MTTGPQYTRLRIYLGEEKRHGDRPLYEAIVLKARQLHLAGATVMRGTLGFGRSTRLHSLQVLFSEDMPVVIEIVDGAQKISDFVPSLRGFHDIGLVTCEAVDVLPCAPADP
jgi:PII-like signaling protein